MSIPVGSYLIPWGKQKAQKPGSTPPQKRHTCTSIRAQGEGTAQTGTSSSGDVESMAPGGKDNFRGEFYPSGLFFHVFPPKKILHFAFFEAPFLPF